jgi:hypothetical protein
MLTYSKLVKNPKIFQRTIGVTVEYYKEIVERMQPYWEESERERLSRPNRQRRIGGGPKYHLRTLEDKMIVLMLYYRTYITMEFLGLLFDMDKSSISRIVERLEGVMKKMNLLPGDKLKKKSSRRKRINNMEDFLKEYPEMSELIIDVTEHPIERPKRKQKKYYSGKKKCHTTKSQINVNRRGEIVTVEGGKPGSKHDKKIFDESWTKRLLPRDINLKGDTGYQGIKDDFPNAKIPFKKKKGGPCLNKIQKRYNRMISRARMVVEHAIRKIKKFKILSYTYRGNRKKHKDIVRNVSYFTNIQSGFVC